MNEIVSYDSYRLECLNIDFYNISPRPILVLRADFIFLDSNVLYVRNKQYERLEKSTRLTTQYGHWFDMHMLCKKMQYFTLNCNNFRYWNSLTWIKRIQAIHVCVEYAVILIPIKSQYMRLHSSEWVMLTSSSPFSSYCAVQALAKIFTILEVYHSRMMKQEGVLFSTSNVKLFTRSTRCSAIAERLRCRVRYSFRQK